MGNISDVNYARERIENGDIAEWRNEIDQRDKAINQWLIDNIPGAGLYEGAKSWLHQPSDVLAEEVVQRPKDAGEAARDRLNAILNGIDTPYAEDVDAASLQAAIREQIDAIKSAGGGMPQAETADLLARLEAMLTPGPAPETASPPAPPQSYAAQEGAGAPSVQKLAADTELARQLIDSLNATMNGVNPLLAPKVDTSQLEAALAIATKLANALRSIGGISASQASSVRESVRDAYADYGIAP